MVQRRWVGAVVGTAMLLGGCSDAGKPGVARDREQDPSTRDRGIDAGTTPAGQRDPARDGAAPTTRDAGLPNADAGGRDAGDSVAGGDPPGCSVSAFRPSAEGLRGACGAASVSLFPVAKINGTWYGAGRSGACRLDQARLVCGAGPHGELAIEIDAGLVRATLRAAQAASVEALGLEGALVLPGARAFLSNGFQSWSQSGVLALGGAPSEKALEQALAARGEDEVYRKGRELSWWYTFAGGGADHFSAGAVTADTFRTFMQVYEQGPSLKVRLISGAGESVAAEAGRVVRGEALHVELGQDLEGMLGRYGRSLASRRTSQPAPVPAGWNSWYDLWDDVRADDIASSAGARNADLAKSILEPKVPARDEPLWIVVDDGWQQAWGTWQANDKFPGGLAALARAVEQRGMRMGVWFAPLLVDPDSSVAKQHPDWLVKNTTYDHPAHGEMRVLDVTQPEAAAHLKDVVGSFVTAGMGLLKIDFLFAGTYEGERHEKVTGMQAYARALQLIREAAGQDMRIVAVGAPPLGTFAYADGWRVGNDIAFKPLPVVNYPRPTWSFIANQARQITSRWPFCLATLCDADPALLRDLKRDEVEAGAWVAMSTGGALFLSDDLRKLPAERRAWGLDPQRIALGLGGVPVTPVSFYPAKFPNELVNMKDPSNLFSAEHDVPSLWRLADGSKLAINFRDQAATIAGASVPPHSAKRLP